MVILLGIFYRRCTLKVGLVSTKAATNRRLIPNAMHNGIFFRTYSPYYSLHVLDIIRRNSSKLYLNSYNATIFDKNLDIILISLNIIYKNKY